MNRPYRQTERARQAEETATRILRTAIAIFIERGYAGLTLVDVADGAGVTTQTVIRRFGDKEGLVRAAGELAFGEVDAQRAEAPVGDLRAAIDNLLDHYESAGFIALRLLADEHLSPVVAAFAQAGRDYHQVWCARVFAPFVTGTPTVRRRRHAELMAICDVHTWDLLRNRAGLSAGQVRTAYLEMLSPLTEGTIR